MRCNHQRNLLFDDSQLDAENYLLNKVILSLDILNLVKQHENIRSSSLNMIASENCLSPSVKYALSVENSRYHAKFYAGTEVFLEIYEKTVNLAKDLFRCSSAHISPLSGNMALLAIIFAFSNPDDQIAILPLFPGGGYPLNLEFFNRKKIDIPYNIDYFNIDISKTKSMLRNSKPPLVILGASLILFPQPIAEIAEEIHKYGGVVIYDASHVLGLIAGRQFQDPLREGVDILLGSTHKSFPGPQGGIILSNNFQNDQLERLIGVDPLEGIGFVDNIHNSRIAALGISFEEFKEYGEDYATQIVKNSKNFANSLNDNQIPLFGEKFGFTESHQVLLKIKDSQEGEYLRDCLYKHKIVTDGLLRFGTAELTHQGFKEQDMIDLGFITAKIINLIRKQGKISPQEKDNINSEVAKLLNRLSNSKTYFQGKL